MRRSSSSQSFGPRSPSWWTARPGRLGRPLALERQIRGLEPEAGEDERPSAEQTGPMGVENCVST